MLCIIYCWATKNTKIEIYLLQVQVHPQTQGMKEIKSETDWRKNKYSGKKKIITETDHHNPKSDQKKVV